MWGPPRLPLYLLALVGLIAFGAPVRPAMARPNSADVHRELAGEDEDDPRAWSASSRQLEQAVDELLVIARTERLELRLAATEVLGEIGSERAIAALTAILWENQIEVRVRAARVLGLSQTPEAMQALSLALETERDVIVRSEVEYAIETGLPMERGRIPEGIRMAGEAGTR